MTTPGGTDTRNVQVQLGAQTDGFQRAMDASAKSVSVLATAVTNLYDKIYKLGSASGKGLTLIGTGSLAGLVGAAEASNRLDKAFTQVRTTAVLTGQSVDGLMKSAQGLSREIPMSTGAIAQLMAQVQNLGLTGTESITRFTKAAAALGAATDTPPGQLFQSLVELGRTMGSNLNDIERYGSALVELSKMNGVNAQGVVDFANAIQSVAARAGYTETQVLGLSTAFQKVGADGFSAANVFIKMTTDISDAIQTNSAQLTTYAALVGKTREEFAKEADVSQGGSPQNAFLDVLSAIKNQGPAAVATLQQLGLDGPRAIKVIAALTSGQADLKGTLEQANGAFERNSATGKSSEQAYKSLSDSMERFRNQIASVVEIFGGPMATSLTHFFDAGTKVLGWFLDVTRFADPFIAKLAGIGAVALVTGGAILTIGTALAKVGLAWRVISSLPVANTLSGFQRGARGLAPAERVMGGRASQMMYDASFAGGGALGRVLGKRDPLGGPGIGERLFNSAYREPLNALSTAPGQRDNYTIFGRRRGGSTTTFEDLNEDTQKRVRNTFAMQRAREARTMERSRLGGLGTADLISEMAAHPSYGKVPINATSMEAFVHNESKAAGTRAFRDGKETFNTVKSDKAVLAAIVAEMQSKKGGGPNVDAVAGDMGKFGGALRGTLGGLGKAVTVLGEFGPALAVAGVAAVALKGQFEKLRDSGKKAADEQHDLGSDLAGLFGLKYSNASRSLKDPADGKNSEAFGSLESKDANSAEFRKSAKTDISRLKQFGNSEEGGAAFITQFFERTGSDSKNPQAMRALREAFLAAYGKRAKSMFDGAMSLTGGDADKALLDNNVSTYKGMIDRHGIFQSNWEGKASQQKFGGFVDPIIQAIGSGNSGQANSALQAFSNASGGSRTAYAAAGMYQGAMTGMTPPGGGGAYGGLTNEGGQKFQAFAARFVTDYNAQNKLGDKDKIKIDKGTGAPVNYDELIAQLKRGNDQAKALADNLEEGAKAAGEDKETRQTIASKLAGTDIGKLAGKQGFDLLGPTNDVNFARQLNTAEYGSLGGKSAIQQTPQQIEEAIAKWRAFKVAVDGNTAAMEKADAVIGDLNAKLAQSRSFSTPFVNALDASKNALDIASETGSGTVTYQDAKAAQDTAEGFITQSVGTLRGYVQQVHDFHIQERRGLQDHNLSLEHMERDHSRQLKEAYYSRNQSLKEQARSYRETLRGMRNEVAGAYSPFEHVDAQYTSGAQGALFNAEAQNRYLQKTKSGLESLKKMGVSNDVVAQLGLDNPQNFQQLERFVEDLANNPKLVQAWNKSVKDKLSLSAAIAVEPNNSKFIEMKRQFDYTANQAKVSFEHSMALAKQGYDTSLADFEQAYKTAQARAMEDLGRLGENLFTSMDSILAAAASSGISNLQKYAQNIQQAIAIAALAQDTLANLGKPGGGTPPSGGSTNSGTGGSGAGGLLAPGDRPLESGGNAASNVSRGDQVRYNNQFNNNATYKGNKDTRSMLYALASQSGADVHVSSANEGYDGDGVHANGSYHYKAEALDIAGSPKEMYKLAAFLYGQNKANYIHMSELIYWDKPTGMKFGIKDGKYPFDYKKSWAGHQNHVHIALNAKDSEYIAQHYNAQFGGKFSGQAKKNQKVPAAAGGVFDQRTDVQLGEAGPEAVIPLNGHGASFIANVIRMATPQGMGAANLRGMRTASHANHIVHNGNISTHYDQHTAFNGSITVQASDPQELERKLASRKRMQALRKPVGGR